MYPTSMQVTISNLYTTRRLFRSYEPFMCKESVKIGSAVPTQWKLNRRLFNLTVKPYLKPTKWLLHGDGRLPYFNWMMNIPIQTPTWLYRQVAKRVGLIKGNQGPWSDWQQVSKSIEWKQLVEEYSSLAKGMDFLIDETQLNEILSSNRVPITIRINLLQIAFHKAQLNK